MSEMDFSSATQSYRVISELVMTTARNTAASDEPQDVAGAAGQRLQQAAGNGDFPPVDSHASPASFSADQTALQVPARVFPYSTLRDEMPQRTTRGLPHRQNGRSVTIAAAMT